MFVLLTTIALSNPLCILPGTKRRSTRPVRGVDLFRSIPPVHTSSSFTSDSVLCSRILALPAFERHSIESKSKLANKSENTQFLHTVPFATTALVRTQTNTLLTFDNTRPKSTTKALRV